MNQTHSSLVKHAIMNSFYVDDLAISVQYKSDIKCVIDDLKQVLLSRGFNLKKYMVNDADLISAVPVCDRYMGMSTLLPSNGECKTLGLMWDVKNDVLLQTTQPTSGGAVTANSSSCANCVEPRRPQQWGPDLPIASSTSINKLQVMQIAALRTATGCTQDTNIHICMTKHSLPIHEHLQLHASQYKQKTQHPSHPLHKHTTYFNTPRLKSPLFLTTAATQQTFPQTPTQSLQQT